MWNNNPFEWGYPDFAWLKKEIEGDHKVIIVSHQPPGSIERYEKANQEMTAQYSHPNVLGSIHGHLHNFSLRRIDGKPVVTIDRVENERYAVLSIDENQQLSIERCKAKICEAADSL